MTKERRILATHVSLVSIPTSAPADELNRVVTRLVTDLTMVATQLNAAVHDLQNLDKRVAVIEEEKKVNAGLCA